MSKIIDINNPLDLKKEEIQEYLRLLIYTQNKIPSDLLSLSDIKIVEYMKSLVDLTNFKATYEKKSSLEFNKIFTPQFLENEGYAIYNPSNNYAFSSANQIYIGIIEQTKEVGTTKIFKTTTKKFKEQYNYEPLEFKNVPLVRNQITGNYYITEIS